MNIQLPRSIPIIFFIFYSLAANGQGNYAGNYKHLVGTIFNENEEISGLENHEFRQGSLISAIDDPESITVAVYQKGTTCVAFFSIMDDTIRREYRIADVLEVKNVQPSW